MEEEEEGGGGYKILSKLYRIRYAYIYNLLFSISIALLHQGRPCNVEITIFLFCFVNFFSMKFKKIILKSWVFKKTI